MKRRAALKNMGLVMGYSMAAPTLISIVQSCKTETPVDWTPAFFTPEEGHVLKLLVDIFLPATDTPSASELNVHLFIDGMADKVMYSESEFLALPLAKQNIENIEERYDDTGYFIRHSRDFLRTAMQAFISKSKELSEKEAVLDLNEQDLTLALESVNEIYNVQEDAREEVLRAYVKGLFSDDTPPPLNEDHLSCVFVDSIRDMTIMGYKTTEFIGENVLAYQPIPGEYIPCGDLDELTGGKAYSLVW